MGSLGHFTTIAVIWGEPLFPVNFSAGFTYFLFQFDKWEGKILLS
jgi:hypothetical protein